MSGLQCWDANGNLVVDLGDYTVKFVGKYQVTVPRGSFIGSVGVSGINGFNSFAAITASNSPGGYGEYYAKTRDNAVHVIYLPTSSPWSDVTLTVEVYTFV